MRKILIIGILVAITIISVGLVTAGFGFSSCDETNQRYTGCTSIGCDDCDGTCDSDGQCTSECTGTCKQYGECVGICDGQGIGKQRNRQQCLTDSSIYGGCRRK